MFDYSEEKSYQDYLDTHNRCELCDRIINDDLRFCEDCEELIIEGIESIGQ